MANKKQTMSLNDVKGNIDEMPGWTPELAKKVANSGTMPTRRKKTTKKAATKKPAAKKTAKKK